MSMIINDEIVEARLIEERRTKGLDGFDEVWEGIYVMSPLANNEHQRIATELTVALHRFVTAVGIGTVYQGANVSDRDNWTENYRVPDVLVFLKETSAQDRGTHWFGGPEFAVEIVSKGDRTLEKLDFYAAIGTQELLVIDRDPWQLTLFQKATDPPQRLAPIGKISPSDESVLTSKVLELEFSFAKSAIRVTKDTQNFVDILANF